MITFSFFFPQKKGHCILYKHLKGVIIEISYLFLIFERLATLNYEILNFKILPTLLFIVKYFWFIFILFLNFKKFRNLFKRRSVHLVFIWKIFYFF